MSPGPSLALVVSSSLVGGRRFGISTSLGHGVGIGLWALLTAAGIAGLVASRDNLSIAMQTAGACLLAYIGVRTLLAQDGLVGNDPRKLTSPAHVLLRGATEGFMLSILNPKIALFFLAIFSHVVRSDASWIETGLMGVAAGLIDAIWYIVVVVMVTTTNLTGVLRAKESGIRKLSGSLLLLVAASLLITVTRRILA